MALIKEEKRLSKEKMRPRNVYKINYYKYKDGTTKGLTGTKTSYIFVIGISSTKVISALKISLIKPKLFFRWLKKLYKPNLTEELVNQSESLEDLLIIDSKDGKKIFNQFVVNSQIYNATETPYRTYLLSSIKNVESIDFNRDLLISNIKS